MEVFSSDTKRSRDVQRGRGVICCGCFGRRHNGSGSILPATLGRAYHRTDRGRMPTIRRYLLVRHMEPILLGQTIGNMVAGGIQGDGLPRIAKDKVDVRLLSQDASNSLRDITFNEDGSVSYGPPGFDPASNNAMYGPGAVEVGRLSPVLTGSQRQTLLRQAEVSPYSGLGQWHPDGMFITYIENPL